MVHFDNVWLWSGSDIYVELYYLKSIYVSFRFELQYWYKE